MSQMNGPQLTEEVVARLAATPDPRLREVMQALVRHLHGFAMEVGLTDDEWMTGIQFLTATGAMCDTVRQEFILLSDTLGLSSLVDIINHGEGGTDATEPTILGPFYAPDAPWRQFGESVVEYDDGGEPAILRGVVRSASGVPIPNAVIDVWQNSATGYYAVQQPGIQPSGNLRGRFLSDAEGLYEIRTVRPVPYTIPSDGPVGALLRTTGRHEWRAAHIHIKASADGFEPLTSHIFDSSSPYLESDTVFGVKGSLIRDFTPNVEGLLVCEHPIVLVPHV